MRLTRVSCALINAPVPHSSEEALPLKVPILFQDTTSFIHDEIEPPTLPLSFSFFSLRLLHRSKVNVLLVSTESLLVSTW